MKTPNLISANDYKRIDYALSTMTPDEFFHTLGNYSIKVSVLPSGKAINVWHQPFIISVFQDNGRVSSLQHYANTTDMKRLFKPL